MRFLKTNTATRITVGPFFDKTDGITPETSITVTSCKLTLMVDDGGVPTLVLDTNPTASGGANDMVHVTGDDAGFYDIELAAGNVNYVGRAMLAITDAAVHCPVFHEFMILPANVYDSLVGGTDTLQADVTQWLGTAAATPSVAGVPEVDLTHVAGATTNVAALATNVDAILTDTSTTLDDLIDTEIATIVSELAKVPKSDGTASWNATALAAINAQVDTALSDYDGPTHTELTTALDALPTAAENADAVWDEDATAHQTGGTFGQAIGDPGANTETIYDAVVTDAAGTNVAADIIAVKAETASILADTNELQTDDYPTTLATLATAAELAKVPKSDGTSSWNATALAAIQSEATDALNAYDPPTNAEIPTAAAIADAVWDEAATGHTDAGKAGEQLWTDLDAVLVDTGTTLQGELDGIQADTEDIQARIPAALTGDGNIKADMLAVSGDTTAADRLEALMDGTIVAQVNDAGASTTAFIADGFTEATNDHFIGRLITFISGALSGQQTAITDYVGATQTFTVTALTEAPANDDFFVIH